MKDWEIFAQGRPGAFHLARDLPYQDAISLHVDESFIVGFLTDGCSASPKSHVGAQLGADFLTTSTVKFLNKRSIGDLPKYLFSSLQSYLTKLTKLQGLHSKSQNQFIHDYLLFTVAGFVITQDLTQLLVCGDSLIMINNFATHEDQDNKPTYPAYRLLTKTLNLDDAKVPKNFTVWEAPTSSIDLVGVASDAFVQREDLLNQAKLVKSDGQLALKLNQWTKINDELSDDASVAYAKRKTL